MKWRTSGYRQSAGFSGRKSRRRPRRKPESSDSADIKNGTIVDGPAIVEEGTATTLSPPGWTAQLIEGGHLSPAHKEKDLMAVADPVTTGIVRCFLRRGHERGALAFRIFCRHLRGAR